MFASSTNVSFQTSFSRSSFSTTWPRLLTSSTRVSKAFGVTDTGVPLRKRWRSERSKWKGPKLHELFSGSPINALEKFWRTYGGLIKDFLDDLPLLSAAQEKKALGQSVSETCCSSF